MVDQLLPPIIDDLSAFVIAGRVKAQPGTRSETEARTPAQGVADAVDAERIGFRRIFLSERWNLKEAGILLGGIGARTTRIDVGSGVIAMTARHPMHAAAMGSTFQAAFGPRFLLGLGRGDDAWMSGGLGQGQLPMAAVEDYVGLIRRLWAGERVAYDGPLGHIDGMALGDRHDGIDPPIWFGTFAMPRAARVAAACMDGVLLVPNLTPDACARAVRQIHKACEQIDRDPESIRIAQCIVTAPELDELETTELADARLFTYIQTPGYKETLARANGWSLDVINEVLGSMAGGETVADARYHRSELVDLARRIPRSWVKETCAIGSISDCIETLAAFRAAGVDELVTYGSTPGQNAKLAHTWALQKKKEPDECLRPV